MKNEIESLNSTVIVVGGGSALAHRLATRWLRLPWPIVRDPQRVVYRAYGLSRPLGLIQQSGTFIVDREGILRYAHGGLNPWAALRPDEMIDTLRRLSARDTDQPPPAKDPREPR